MWFPPQYVAKNVQILYNNMTVQYVHHINSVLIRVCIISIPPAHTITIRSDHPMCMHNPPLTNRVQVAHGCYIELHRPCYVIPPLGCAFHSARCSRLTCTQLHPYCLETTATTSITHTHTHTLLLLHTHCTYSGVWAYAYIRYQCWPTSNY